MYIYNRFDKVVEAFGFASATLGVFTHVFFTGITPMTALYLLMAVYWGRLLLRHWRTEFFMSSSYDAYRRVLRLLKARAASREEYCLISPDRAQLLTVRCLESSWYRWGYKYWISIIDNEHVDDWALNPGRMLSFSIPPSFGYVVADEMIRQVVDNETVHYALPRRSLMRTMKQAILDQPIDNEMLLTEADLVYVENALLTWEYRPERFAE